MQRTKIQCRLRYHVCANRRPWRKPNNSSTLIITPFQMQIKHPELPRANKAVSSEKPDGGSTASNRSVLQQHVDFFDSDKDGESIRPVLTLQI